MRKPKYKDLKTIVEPVISSFNNVKILTRNIISEDDETLTPLNSKELRVLADYLDTLISNNKNKGEI